MNLVIDASSAVRLLIERDARASMRWVEEADRIDVPSHFDIECVTALRNVLLRGHIDDTAFIQYAHAVGFLPFTRHEIVPLMDRVIQLRHNATPYDASYIALAEALGALFVTDDARLASIPGIHCTVVQSERL